MQILIAEDESVSRLALQRVLQGWGYEVTALGRGDEAWELLRQPDSPRLALLDWEMPGLSGPDLCRQARELATDQPHYLILLTGRDCPEDIATGLRSGANDYLVKPFHKAELEARLGVARRTL